MRILTAFVLYLLAIGWIAPVGEASATDSRTPDSLAEMSWIAGDWVGDEDSTWIQEIWSLPKGNTMTGMFRMEQDGQDVFYEFMTIAVEEHGITLRIKHFNPGLVGWEKKEDSVAFELTESVPGRAVFATVVDGQKEYLTYQRTGDALVIILEKPAKDTRSEFRFQRAEHP